MFGYTLAEKFKKKGLSLDAIAPEMRNRFNATFAEKTLNDRLQVRLDEKTVRFFFYAGEDTTGTIVEEDYKEIASVSLTNKKETGQDILYLKEQITTKCTALECDCINTIPWKKVCQNLAGNKDGKKESTILFNFPFVNSWNWDTKEENCKEWFVFFMQCCFLYFIFEFENREGEFPTSPIYESVRNMLRDCMVYQLLCAKLKYTFYLYQGEVAFSEDEYTFKTQKFADLLMNEKITKIVPSYYFLDNLWFYDFEMELDLVTGKDFSVCKKSIGTNVDIKLQRKIRDYFFRHHAVASAMGSKKYKRLYGLYIVLTSLFCLFATFCLLCFDKDIKVVNWFFENLFIWDIIAFVAFAVLFYLSIFRSINVFMPRVSVALGIGWLTAFVSEDLIKSQLEIGPVFTRCAFFLVSLLIIVMLFGEAKQHSPYYFNFSLEGIKRLFLGIKRQFLEQWKYPSRWKLIPILAHSYFWALTLGTVMQFALYDDLLKGSKVLPEVVYDDVFGEADTYIMRLENMKEVLKGYEDDWEDLMLSNAVLTGYSKGSQSIEFLKQTSTPDLGKFVSRCKTKQKIIVDKYDALAKIRDEVLQDTIMKSRDLLFGGVRFSESLDIANDHLPFTCLFNRMNQFVQELDLLNRADLSKKSHDSLVKAFPYLKKMDTVGFEYMKLEIVKAQMQDLDEMIFRIDDELQKSRLFVSDNASWIPLINWAKYPSDTLETVSNYQEYLQEKAILNHDLYRDVRMLWVGVGKKSPKPNVGVSPKECVVNKAVVETIASSKDRKDGSVLTRWIRDIKVWLPSKRIYPRMLVFHSLIVLIIAFVGQLIVSDKSVTEPL